ncbi:uncharacterized protein METZ01_LOCUS478002, partial [marine metagenome]
RAPASARARATRSSGNTSSTSAKPCSRQLRSCSGVKTRSPRGSG